MTGVAGAGALTAADAKRLEECLASGGVAIFPADTVYGLACDPLQREAVERLYALKGRPPERPAAVMFFALQAALDALPELGERERAAMRALLPGPLTLLLPNREHRYPLAWCLVGLRRACPRPARAPASPASGGLANGAVPSDAVERQPLRRPRGAAHVRHIARTAGGR